MSLRYLEMPPGTRLAQYIECYWSTEPRRGSQTHSILPDGCADILFSTRNGEPLSLSLVGLMTSPQSLDVPASTAFFGVRFRPGMAALFVREAGLMTDRVEPLDNLWGAKASSIADRLAESTSLQQRAWIMENTLHPTEPFDPLQRALAQLPDSVVSVNHLGLGTRLSERHFRRAFVERTGVPPKYLSRILRFRGAVNRIHSLLEQTGIKLNWARFAADCGYYDQAHLIREFREFAHCTPGRFVQSQTLRQGLESDNDERNEARQAD